MTDPDWEPIMKKASAIVTNRGGRTCHAAIIARELGIPAVVGTGNSTKVLSGKETVSVSCCEGDTGYVYDGKMDYEKIVINKSYTKPSNLKVMMNVGNPDLAFQFQKIPNDGVGLARLEFIINKNIGIHPKAILQIDKLHGDTKNKILESIQGYPTPKDFYISKLEICINVNLFMLIMLKSKIILIRFLKKKYSYFNYLQIFYEKENFIYNEC